MANSYKNALLDLTTTAETTLYTVPTATSTIFKSILESILYYTINIYLSFVYSTDSANKILHKQLLKKE